MTNQTHSLGEPGREIGRVYAPLAPDSEEVFIPGHSDEALFESEAVPADVWEWFASSDLCDNIIGMVEHEGFLDHYEEAWFRAPKLPALIALIEAGVDSAPGEAQIWLRKVTALARRAGERRVAVTFAVAG